MDTESNHDDSVLEDIVLHSDDEQDELINEPDESEDETGTPDLLDEELLVGYSDKSLTRAKSQSTIAASRFKVKPMRHTTATAHLNTNLERLAKTRGARISGPPKLTKHFKLLTAGHVLIGIAAASAKFGVNSAREVLQHLEEYKEFVVVLRMPVTTAAKTLLKDRQVQWFTLAEMEHMPLDHALVSDHVRVKSVPGNISLESGPYIHLSDIIVRVHGWPIGTIVRTTRRIGGAHEKLTYYRRVIQ
jgi:hypothetical protein